MAARVFVWLGGALFVLAGCAFILLCMFAGFAAFTAHGIDVQVPDAKATKTLVVAGVTWWTGLAIAITGVLGSGLFNAIMALSVVFVPQVVRVSESVATQARGLDFVEAARASGTTTLQIIRHHILNNVLGTILVYGTSLVSLSIILSAGLSFLGLGVTPPQAEWGVMLNSLRQAIYVQPLVAALPGLMIFATSMCFNLLSDGIRGAMDVRLNR